MTTEEYSPPVVPIVPTPISSTANVPTKTVQTFETNGQGTPKATTTVTQLSLGTEVNDVRIAGALTLIALLCFGLSYIGVSGVLLWQLVYLTVNLTPARVAQLSSVQDNVVHLGIASVFVLGAVIVGRDVASKVAGSFLK